MDISKYLSISLLSLATASTAYSQCVVAGTDFDTKPALGCPILPSTNEEGGWYNENLDLNSLYDGVGYSNVNDVKQFGVRGRLFTNSNGDMTDVNKIFLMNKMSVSASDPNAVYGYSTVTAQPKLIHPFFKANLEENNMFVNVGSGVKMPFLSYTVDGLAPGTTVELSFTLHNLMDITYFEHLAKNVCVGPTAPVMSDFITKYSYSNTGLINGNELSLGVVSSDDNVEFVTAYDNSLHLINCKNVTTTKVGFGKSVVVKHKATVPETGIVTFYFYRASDCFQNPVGIDDIKVNGEIKPVLTSFGKSCPVQPLMIKTKQNYPADTKYSWKEGVTGQTSTTPSFAFIPDDADTKYTVTCEVTLPGCESAISDDYVVESDACCQTSDGTPMSMTYLFYDDFGNFPDDNIYEWTDRLGVTHVECLPAEQVHSSQAIGIDVKVPFAKAYNIEASGAKLNVPMAGGSKTELYNHGVYVISRGGGYPDGVQYDNSGTTTGGMLQFDLHDDGSQDDFFELEFDHICTGKYISFGASVASISAYPGHVELSLECDGKVLIAKEANFTGGKDGWIDLSEEFVLSPSDFGGVNEVNLKMKLRHVDDLSGETRDYAIDNIFFAVCTPPDVILESSLANGNDMCDFDADDIIVLNALASSNALDRFYLYSDGMLDAQKKLGYVYQYTFDNPSLESETNPISWNTIHKEEVLEDGIFELSVKEYWDSIFSKLYDDSTKQNNVYYRVVVGEYSDMMADYSWKNQSYFSPCRKTSISRLPVVSRLSDSIIEQPQDSIIPVDPIIPDVPGCETADGIPTGLTYLYYDDFGFFTDDNEYVWKDKFGTTHTVEIPEGQVHHAQALVQEVVVPVAEAEYLKANGAKLNVPMAGGANSELYDHGVYVISRCGGYPGGVQYDNSGTTTGGMLQFDLKDDGSQDEFFQLEIDGWCRGKEISFGADVASISRNSGHIEMYLQSAETGAVVASVDAKLEGSGWTQMRGSHVTKNDEKLVLKMRHVDDIIGETRDYAIDNIFIATCTAPDVTLDYASTTGSVDLKHLNDKDVLILFADMSDDAMKYYAEYGGGDVNYVFQYTCDDPTKVNEDLVKWYDLAPMSDQDKCEIAVATHQVFTSDKIDKGIYFRVVAGDPDYLSAADDWRYMSVFSPCRAVSISPILAGGLDFTESYENVVSNNVSIAPNPASTMISVIADADVDKVEISTVVGEVVMTSHSKEINISSLANGVYFVRVTADGETSVHKLMIAK